MNRAWTLCRHWLPEISLMVAALYFFILLLDSFRSPCLGESTFLIFAKEMAAGRGYEMPMLDGQWEFPVYPVRPFFFAIDALPIWLFGFSVTAARAPMVLFLIGSTLLFYRFAERIAGKGNARWATALLISLSAFVNTGKPVLGEIPSFFFHLAGLLFMIRALEERGGKTRPLLWSTASGLIWGIPAGLKVTNIIVIPGLAIAGAWALLRHRQQDAARMFLMTGTAAIPFVLWKALELFYSQAEFIGRYKSYAAWQIVVPDHGVTLALLLRIPYLAFGVMLILGMAGLWSARKKLHPCIVIVVATSIMINMAYFLAREGWYRHLLPAHLFLLPFVPIGVFAILRKRLGALFLISVILLQGWWQLTYRGSSRGPRGVAAAEYVAEHFQDRDLIVQQPEVYMRLEPNPRWRFLLPSMPLLFLFPSLTLSPEEQCMPIVRALSAKEQERLEEQATRLEGKIFLIDPPESCRVQ